MKCFENWKETTNDETIARLLELFSQFQVDINETERILLGSSRPFGMSNSVEGGTRCSKSGKPFFDAHEIALREIFGARYDGFRDSFVMRSSVHEDKETLSELFYQMLIVSGGLFDASEPDSIKAFDLHSVANYLYFDWVCCNILSVIKNEFKAAYERGELGLDAIEEFCEGNPAYTGLFVGILVRSERGMEFIYRLATYMSVENRHTLFCAVFDHADRACLMQMFKYAELDGDMLSELYEALPYAEYVAELDGETKQELLDSVLGGDYLRYIAEDTHTFFFVAAALWALDKAGYDKFISNALESADINTVRAAMYSASHFSRNIGEYLGVIFTHELEFEDYAIILDFYEPSECDAYNEAIVDRLLSVLDRLPKNGVLYQENDKFAFSRGLTSHEIIGHLADIYEYSHDARIPTALFEKLNKLNVMGKLEWLYEFGDMDNSDHRKLVLSLLTSKSLGKWQAVAFINNTDFMLRVSDMETILKLLRSKSEATRFIVLTEAARSRYAREIAAELANMHGCVAQQAARDLTAFIDKGYTIAACGGEVSKKATPPELASVLADPPVSREFEPISTEKLKELFDGFNAFAERNADYEYVQSYKGLVKLGESFGMCGETAEDLHEYEYYELVSRFDSFPCGDELYELVRNTLTDEEICDFVFAVKCISLGRPDLYSAVHAGKTCGAIEFLFNNDHSETVRSIAVETIYATTALADYDLRLEFAVFIAEAGNSDYALKAAAEIVLVCLENGYVSNVNNAVYVAAFLSEYKFVMTKCFMNLYEAGKITDEFAEYLIEEGVIPVFAVSDIKDGGFASDGESYDRLSAFIDGYLDRIVVNETKRYILPETGTDAVISYSGKFKGAKAYMSALRALRGLNYTEKLFGTKSCTLSKILRDTVASDNDSYENFEKECDGLDITKSELEFGMSINGAFKEHSQKYISKKFV